MRNITENDENAFETGVKSHTVVYFVAWMSEESDEWITFNLALRITKRKLTMYQEA